MPDREEVICNIAAWGYSDEGGRYLNVEISLPYKPTKTARPDILESIFTNDTTGKVWNAEIRSAVQSRTFCVPLTA